MIKVSSRVSKNVDYMENLKFNVDVEFQFLHVIAMSF